MPGSIQVSSKEMASVAGVGHEAEFWLWGGTLMTMVLYGVDRQHCRPCESPCHTLGHVLGEGGHYQWAFS